MQRRLVLDEHLPVTGELAKRAPGHLQHLNAPVAGVHPEENVGHPVQRQALDRVHVLLDERLGATRPVQAHSLERQTRR